MRLQEVAIVNVQILKPEAVAPGNASVATPIEALGDKRSVGVLAGGMSIRWVDLQLARGMPHLKLGARRVRFDLGEVRSWLKQQYGTQRRAA